MKIKKIVSVYLIMLSTSLFAQESFITNFSFSKSEDAYQFRIFSSQRVPFGSIWLEQNKRLVIYLREARWRGEKNSILPEEGPIKKISARQMQEQRNVVEIFLDFNDVRKYTIDYDGFDIVASIEGEKFSSETFPAENKSFSNRIERIGLLNAPNKISMDYRGADLQNVLRLLAKQNNLNIIPGNEVTGNVTLSLRNVTIREALDNILLVNGYDYVINKNVVLVKKGATFYPSLTETKVYHLKYLDAYNIKNVIAQILPEGTKIQVLSPGFYSEGEQDGKKASGGAEKVKKRSSTLIVTDKPEVLRKIDEIIEKLDIPKIQIVIESKLLELSPSQNDRIGIDWDKTITTSLLSENALVASVERYSVKNEGFRTQNSWKLGNLTASQFSVVLDFLKENAETKLISNPRVIATDNMTSRISVGTTFPVPQITRGVGGQGDIVTFIYKDVNIQLNVTPHVVEGNKIIMDVNPVIEEITGEVIVDENRAPITTKRTVSTVVTVRDGETVVIGGMIKEDRQEITRKVFILGDIPLIGKLFRHTVFELKQKDLVIFITPHILKQ